jgi:hypothetical protein
LNTIPFIPGTIKKTTLVDSPNLYAHIYILAPFSSIPSPSGIVKKKRERSP